MLHYVNLAIVVLLVTLLASLTDLDELLELGKHEGKSHDAKHVSQLVNRQ